jgi:methylglutaconyl-CoA hydratase
LGLAPGVISPFVVSKIGESHARRYFLTGERFSAAKALSLGLVHEVVEEEALDKAVDDIIAALLKGGPSAQEACKALAREGRLQMSPDALDEDNAKVIAALRVSPEGQEGLAAFFEGRAPSWVPGEGA